MIVRSGGRVKKLNSTPNFAHSKHFQTLQKELTTTRTTYIIIKVVGNLQSKLCSILQLHISAVVLVVVQPVL